MARPLRIDIPGAVHHVTSRGDRRESIFIDEIDRRLLLDLLREAAKRFDVRALAYCQMGNHYHLVVQTREANLSRFMRDLNGKYTQRFNRRHGLDGHVFRGRFHSVLVDRDAYLLNLCRYVERNPVAAGLVDCPTQWPWSSCRAHLGLAPVPDWLDADGLLEFILSRPLRDDTDRRHARDRYRQLVGEPVEPGFWDVGLRQGRFLGDDGFVERTITQRT